MRLSAALRRIIGWVRSGAITRARSNTAGSSPMTCSAPTRTSTGLAVSSTTARPRANDDPPPASAAVSQRSSQRIFGPLLDRIDLHVEVPLVDFRELSATAPSGESPATIRQRVIAARHIQVERFKKSVHRANAAMNARQVRQHCQLDTTASGYLEQAMSDMNFSARAHDRILKVARTHADLAGAPDIRRMTFWKPSIIARWTGNCFPEL